MDRGAPSSFQFISVQRDDIAAHRCPAKETRRQARSHAIKQAIHIRRKSQKGRLDHFRHYVSSSIKNGPSTDPEEPNVPPTCSPELVKLASFPGGMSLDPFGTLPVNSVRLQALLEHPASRQAVEPIFSLAGSSPFLNFQTVFQAGLEDVALSSALLMSLVLATGDGHNFTIEHLTYRDNAIRCINGRLQHVQMATKPATIGAILLLAGVEYRAGDGHAAQAHLNGIRQIMGLCKDKRVLLPDGIKRAIFWQDLNSAMLTGSPRVFDHAMFPELSWTRDPFLGPSPTAPCGFEEQAALLSADFLSLVQDIYALQLSCDSVLGVMRDAVTLRSLDNQQAWIESRLYWCWKNTAYEGDGATLERCCVLAAYICTYALHTETWEASLIPAHCSARLLDALQETYNGTTAWLDHQDLVLWLVVTGGSFAAVGECRREYVALLNGVCWERLDHCVTSWPSLELILQRFIWSQRTIMPVCRRFWEESISLYGE